MTIEELQRMLLCVNATEWCGYPAGTLLIAKCTCQWTPKWLGFSCSEMTTIDLIEDPKGWNNIPWRDGTRYPCVDCKGRSLYDPVEFPAESRDLRYTFSKRPPLLQETPDADTPVVVK